MVVVGSQFCFLFFFLTVLLKGKHEAFSLLSHLIYFTHSLLLNIQKSWSRDLVYLLCVLADTVLQWIPLNAITLDCGGLSS